MRDYQAVVRVRHPGNNLAEAVDQLDAVTGELVDYGATARMWDDVTEWTMTVRVPSLWDVGAVAGRTVRGAFVRAGWDVDVVRVDAWQVAEWESAKGLSE